MATLCIADPPYPPSVAMRYDVPGGRVVSRSRARRYYGDGTMCATERLAERSALGLDPQAALLAIWDWVAR